MGRLAPRSPLTTIMADAIIVVSGERGARRPMICKPFAAAARCGFISLDHPQNTRF